MIITRSPLRITLGGGGTDLPPYVHEHGGFCLSAAIDKYVYITLHRRFDERLVVKYLEVENVSRASELRHPLTRETLGWLRPTKRQKGLEIASHADIPAGTGLGSSGAFTCALLAALGVQGAEPIAKAACEIEIDRCGEPVGKQDPYISALGGIQALTFCPDGRVQATPVAGRPELRDNLLLFYTGQTRRAREILSVAPKMSWNDVKDLGYVTHAAIEQGRLDDFAECLTQQWLLKRAASPKMSSPQIDGWFAHARNHGALGGKLCGAGGGGFLLFYAEDPQRLIQAMPLPHVPFRFDWEGTKVLVS